MPRRLQRKGYGWSLTYGKDQRKPSEEYKENYDKIKWSKDFDEYEDGKNSVFGNCKRKVFK